MKYTNDLFDAHGISLLPPEARVLYDASPEAEGDPTAGLRTWTHVDPTIAGAQTDPVEIERYRIVDNLCALVPRARDHIPHLLAQPIERLREAWHNRPARRDARIRARQRQHPLGQSQRLPDTGDLRQDWALDGDNLIRIERWGVWADGMLRCTEVRVPCATPWCSWAGRRLRTQQIRYALQNPEYTVHTTVGRTTRAPRGTHSNKPVVQSSDTLPEWARQE